MKRILAFVLVVLMLLPFAGACGQSELQEQTKAAEETVTETKVETAEAEETEPAGMVPQSDYEKKVTRILVLGNSGSNDVFFQLGRVFNAQGFGGKQYTLAFLYYSGCKFSQHVEFMNRNDPVYDYRKTNDVGYVTETGTTMEHALEDEQWDVILLHPGGSDDLTHKDLKKAFRKQIEEYVNEHVPTEHVFGYLHRATNPDDEVFFSPDWWRQPPEGFRATQKKNYGTEDYLERYKIEMDLAKANILSDPTYEYTINTASGMAYAHKILGVSQTALYRDYTHLSDLGRVLSAYCLYAQFTGEAIEEVKLDSVPAKARQAHYQSQGDLVLTEDLKHIIKESANFSLQHPWEIPS
ncbi:MAG: DUF4886 domain-containing protein [Clostridia bacterium]|nr:DUF4886 domain-containing protein [Clostridia bacterium]